MGNFYNEISISSKINEEKKDDSLLSNENLVKFFVIANIGDKTFLAYEYCNGGDLREYMNYFENFDELTIQIVISQILKGLQFLHNKKVVHHDIKPDNILVELCVEGKTQEEKDKKIKKIKKEFYLQKYRNGNYDDYLYILELFKKSKFKLADFGISKFIKETNKIELSFTPKYCDINLLLNNGLELDTVENEKVDIWAVGVLAYELKFGIIPFSSPKSLIPKESLKEGKYYIDMKTIKIVSKQFLSFLNACLQEEQKIRPLTDELLNHEFIARDPQFFKYMSYDDKFENYKPRYTIGRTIVKYKKEKYPKGDYLKTEGKITMNIRDNRMINALFDTIEEDEKKI